MILPQKIQNPYFSLYKSQQIIEPIYIYMVAPFRLEFFCAKPIMKKQKRKGRKEWSITNSKFARGLSSCKGGFYTSVFS